MSTTPGAVFKTRDNAIVRDPSAINRRPRAEAASRARAPLGLSVPDDDRGEERSAGAYVSPVDEIARGAASTLESLGGRAAAEASTASTMDMLETLTMSLTAAAEGDEKLYDLLIAERKRTTALEAKVEALTIQLAEMRGALAERARATILRP
jgi:hypothetical protein